MTFLRKKISPFRPKLLTACVREAELLHMIYYNSVFKIFGGVSTFQNIGGRNHGPSTHLNLWGDRPQFPPCSVSAHAGYHDKDYR